MIKVNITYFAEHSDVPRSRRRRVLSGGQARLPAVLGRERVGGARGEELGLGLLPPVVVERVRSTSEENVLAAQSNLALTYSKLGRDEEALQIERDVYSGFLKLQGEEHEYTLSAASNYANSLVGLQRFEEAKALLRETMPVARRVLGESHDLKLRMGWNYALALYRDNGATLDDLHEAVSTLESVARLWTRIFGEAHPETPKVQGALEVAREKLADARAAASNKSKPPP